MGLKLLRYNGPGKKYLLLAARYYITYLLFNIPRQYGLNGLFSLRKIKAKMKPQTQFTATIFNIMCLNEAVT